MPTITKRGQDNWNVKRGNASWQRERMRPDKFAPLYGAGWVARLIGRLR